MQTINDQVAKMRARQAVQTWKGMIRCIDEGGNDPMSLYKCAPLDVDKAIRAEGEFTTLDAFAQSDFRRLARQETQIWKPMAHSTLDQGNDEC